MRRHDRKGHTLNHRTDQSTTIIGAGLVGSLLATMLGRRGYHVDVFEKRPDLRRTDLPAGRSINLAMAERGLHALRQAGLFETIQPLLIPMRGRQLHLADGREEFVPYGQHPWELIYSVSRLELNSRLMSAAEATQRVQIHFEHECRQVDLRQRQLEVCHLVSHDVQRGDYGWLLGADGAGSILRHAIVEEQSGIDSVEMLDHAYKELTIPAGPAGSYRLRREALHIWPRGGFMLIALPNLDGSFTTTLFLPSESRGDQPSFRALSTPAAVRTFFRQHFADAVPHLPRLEAEFFENPTGELGTVRCWPWSSADHALILGDAAHAIVPFHGQGMNAGFEDCAELLRLLAEFDDDRGRVCREFPQLRKAQADAIAEMALDNYIDMRDTTQRPDFLLRKEIGFELERRLPDYFIPRYSMVMFHRLPYADVLARGRVQQQLLDELLRGGVRALHEVDWQAAEQRVRETLSPLPSAES